MSTRAEVISETVVSSIQNHNGIRFREQGASASVWQHSEWF